MSSSDVFELERYIKKTFQPEKQQAITNQTICGNSYVAANKDNVSMEELELVLANLESLPHPQLIRSYKESCSKTPEVAWEELTSQNSSKNRTQKHNKT
jgi:hypothetical protein